MRYQYKIVVIVLLMVAGVGHARRVDEVLLQHVAETEGYGYKFANLSQLVVMVSEFNESEKGLLRAAVPEFFGLPSPLIQKYLRNEERGIDIEARWISLLKKYFADKSIEQLFADKRFPKGFIEDADVLAHDIKQVFNEIAKRPSLEGLFSRKDAEMVTRVKTREERLMLRSSGREDTKTLANAGGNESISNVVPEFDDIFRALGDVIASYFEARSLTQRLAAKDGTLLDPIPFTPAIVQRMIGEKKDAIPRCGVMFTEDAEGSVSRLAPGKTSGIALIQAAYGHNEAVVNSRIPVDSFYVDAAASIFPVIKLKSHRMQPAEESGVLNMVRNDGALARTPALNKDEVTFMKRLAEKLEDFYSMPMDVEFVISDEGGGTVNLVQARPIVHRRDLPDPSYLRFPNRINGDDIIKGQAIGVAGGSLRFIESGARIIVAATINDALGKYQNRDLTPDPDKIEAIVVGNDAPATSHEATSFRSDGKPVIFSADYERAETWLLEGGKLVVSPQQGLVANFRGDEVALDAIVANNEIALKGWESYPAPAQISLHADFLPEKSILQDLLLATMRAKEQGVIWRVTDEQIARIKKGGRHDALDALEYFRAAIFQALDRASQGVKMTEGRTRRIASLRTYVLVLTDAVSKHLDINETDALFPRRLLPIRFFEAVLKQSAQESTTLFTTSVLSLIGNELLAEQKIMKEFSEKELDLPTLLYLRARDFAMSPGLDKKWQYFAFGLQSHHGDEDIKREFLATVTKLAKLELLPIWLHTSFAHAHDVNPIETARKLIEEVAREQKFLDELAERRAELDALSMQSFASPKSYRAQWYTFRKTLLNYFIDPAFLGAFKGASEFGRLAAVPTMAKMVDSLDLSIKALKGSRLFSDEAKLTNLREMLLGYRELFKTWFGLVPTGGITFSSMPDGSAEKYFELVDKVLAREALNRSDLDATPGFNATAFTIGSGLAIMTVFPHPQTLEDAFTVIHQSLLVILGALNKESGASRIGLPRLLNAVDARIMNINRSRSSQSGGGMTLIGISIAQSSIEMLYNFPLQNHSMQVGARYEKATDSVAINVRFFGHGGDRWTRIGVLIELLGQIGKLKVSALKVRDTGVEFVVNLTKDSEADEVFKVIQNAVDITFGFYQIDLNELVKDIPKERLSAAANALLKRVGGTVLTDMKWIIELAVATVDTVEGWTLTKTIVANLSGFTAGTDADIILFDLFEKVLTHPLGREFYGDIALKLLGMWNNVRWDETKRMRLIALVNKIDRAEEDASAPLKKRITDSIASSIQPTPTRIFRERGGDMERELFGSFLDEGAKGFDLLCTKDGPPCRLTVLDFNIDMVKYHARAIAIRFLAFLHRFVVEDAVLDHIKIQSSYRIRFDTMVDKAVIDQLMRFFSATGDAEFSKLKMELEKQPELLAVFVQHVRDTVGFSTFENNHEFASLMPNLTRAAAGSALIESFLSEDPNPQFILERIINEYQHGDGTVQKNIMALIDRISTVGTDEPVRMRLRARLTPMLLLNQSIPGAADVADRLMRGQITIATLPNLMTALGESNLFSSSPEIALKKVLEIFDFAQGEGLSRAAVNSLLASNVYWRLNNAVTSGNREQQRLALSIIDVIIAARPHGDRLHEMMRWFINLRQDQEFKVIIQKLIEVAKEDQYKDHFMTQDALKLLTGNQ